MFTIALLNLKGGCGKSTISINLAACLPGKVVLIDLDPQQSVTRWALQSGKGLRNVHSMTLGDRKAAKQFKAEIDRLATKADWVILDTPPQLEKTSLFAALISDILLIPVTASPLDVWAAESAVKTGRDAKRERAGRKPKIVLIPSRVQPQTVLGRELSDTLKALGEVVGPAISQRVALVESAVVGETIDIYAPESPSHVEFKQLAQYIIDMRR